MLLLNSYLVVHQKARGYSEDVTAHSPTPTFKNQVKST